MVDPADEFNTPYSYVGSNPIIYIDPDGAQYDIFVDGIKQTSSVVPKSLKHNVSQEAWNWLYETYGNSSTDVHIYKTTDVTIAQTNFRKKGSSTDISDMVSLGGKEGVFVDFPLSQTEFLIKYNPSFLSKSDNPAKVFDHEFNHIVQYSFLIKNFEPIMPGNLLDGSIVSKSYNFSPTLSDAFLKNNRAYAKSYKFSLWSGGDIEWGGIFGKPVEPISPELKKKVE